MAGNKNNHVDVKVDYVTVKMGRPLLLRSISKTKLSLSVFCSEYVSLITYIRYGRQPWHFVKLCFASVMQHFH